MKRSKSPSDQDSEQQKKKSKVSNPKIIFSFAAANNSPKLNGNSDSASADSASMDGKAGKDESKAGKEERIESKDKASHNGTTKGSHRSSPMKIDTKKSKSGLVLKNTATIRKDDVREQGYQSLKQGDARANLQLFLKRVIKSSKQTAKGKTKDKRLNLLCYHLLGSDGRFGFFYYKDANEAIEDSGGLISRFIMHEQWDLVEFALKHLHHYMQKSEVKACADYPKEELLAFIAKSMIVACAELQCQQLMYKEHDNDNILKVCAKIKKFFEKYKIDINRPTRLPKPHGHGSEGYASHYEGICPLIPLLSNDSVHPAYVELTLALGCKVSFEHLEIALEHYTKYGNRKIANALLALLIDAMDNNSKIPLNLFFNKDVDKQIIMRLRQSGIKPDFKGELLEMRRNALHYGLADLYQASCKLLAAKDKYFRDNLEFSAQALVLLLKSPHFDEHSLQLLTEELQHYPQIVKHPEFFAVFEAWFSGFVLCWNPYHNGLNGKSMAFGRFYDSREQPMDRTIYRNNFPSLPKEQAQALLSLLAKLFAELYSRSPDTPSPMQGEAPSHAQSQVSTLLQGCFHSTIGDDALLQILNALVQNGGEHKQAREDKQHRECTALLRDAFNFMLSLPKYGTDFHAAPTILLYLINAGGNPAPLLVDLAWAFHGKKPLKMDQAAFQKLCNFFKRAEIQGRMDDIALNQAFAEIASKGTDIDLQSALVLLLPFCREGFMLDWRLMLAAHIKALPGQVNALGYESKSLNTTKFLIQKFGQGLSIQDALSKESDCSILEFIALQNRDPSDKDLLKQHEAYFKELFDKQMNEAIQMAERRRSLENVVGVAYNGLGNGYHGWLRGKMVELLATRMNGLMEKKEQEEATREIPKEAYFSDLIQKSIAYCDGLVRKNATKYFTTDRYQLDTTEAAQQQLKFVTDAFFSSLTTSLLTEPKRANDIWQSKHLRILRVYSLLKRLSNMRDKQKYAALLLNNIGMLFYSLKGSGKHMLLLIDALVDIDGHYSSFYRDSRELDYPSFVQFLVRLAWALPESDTVFNNPDFQTAHLQAIRQHLKKIYLETEKGSKEQLEAYAREKGCIDPQFVHKHRNAVLQALQNDLNLCYLSRKLIEERLSKPLSVKDCCIFEKEVLENRPPAQVTPQPAQMTPLFQLALSEQPDLAADPATFALQESPRGHNA